MINITVLGATGSIGLNTLEVIAQYPERFKVIALTANHNIAILLQQCLRFQPIYAVVREPAAAAQLQTQLQQQGSAVQVLAGEAAISEVAMLAEVDYVMAAIVGAAGLLPTLAAVRAGKRVLLANKEPLVMAGQVFMQAVQQHNAVLLPVDSEHNAIFQCLPSQLPETTQANIRRIILTASGGPFRETPLHDFATLTPAQACAHPVWSMGRKISVDSATMMNKGFEVIEAHWLFQLPAEKIEVVLHPQSTIHGLVEYEDGSILAQMAQPDMRVPIAHALAWPERMASGAKPLDFLALGRLDFAPLCLTRYPCLQLAYQALAVGDSAPTVLNAANEVAVQAFLEEKLPFSGIAPLIERVLNILPQQPVATLEAVLAVDASARALASQCLPN